MLRKFLGIIIGLTIVFGASACTVATEEAPADSGFINPAPAPMTSPETAPPVVDNPLVPVSSPVDRATFVNVPQVAIEQRSDSVLVSIMITGESDWQNFAGQVGIDPNEVDPTQIQLFSESSATMTDLNALFVRIAEDRYALGYPAINLETDVLYDLIVLP